MTPQNRPLDSLKTHYCFYCYRQSGSRRLDFDRDKREISDIFYQRGYAKAKHYDADRGGGLAKYKLIKSALDDFQFALRQDQRHLLARAAVGKLIKRIPRRFGDSIDVLLGQGVIFVSSLVVFLLAQLDFFLGNTAQHSALRLPTPAQLPAGYYVSVTFAALAIMIATLSLPKLLELTVLGIKLTKVSPDQTTATSSLLGVQRLDLLSRVVSNSFRSLNAAPPRLSRGKDGDAPERTDAAPDRAPPVALGRS
jgi:hypothetical protein